MGEITAYWHLFRNSKHFLNQQSALTMFTCTNSSLNMIIQVIMVVWHVHFKHFPRAIQSNLYALYKNTNICIIHVDYRKLWFVMFTQISILIWVIAALIIIFIWKMSQMTTCNVKGIIYCDERTKDYHLTQFPSTLWRILPSLSSLFWFCGPHLYCFGSLEALSSTQTGSCCQKKAQLNHLYTTRSAPHGRQVKGSDKLVTYSGS